MATGRLLLIAPIKHNNRKIEMEYGMAHKMNDVAARLAKVCNSRALGSIRKA